VPPLDLRTLEALLVNIRFRHVDPGSELAGSGKSGATFSESGFDHTRVGQMSAAPDLTAGFEVWDAFAQLPPIFIHKAEQEAGDHSQDEQDREGFPEPLGRFQAHPVIEQPENEADGG
jgi:hypothetical protein